MHLRRRGTRPGTVGHSVWGVEVEIADAAVLDRIDLLPPGETGEIVIRGHNVFAGYLNRPDATAEVMIDGRATRLTPARCSRGAGKASAATSTRGWCAWC